MVAASLHYRCNIVAESPHREDCLKYNASYGYSNVTFSLHFCNETREDRIRQTSNQCSTALVPQNQPTSNRTPEPTNRRINHRKNQADVRFQRPRQIRDATGLTFGVRPVRVVRSVPEEQHADQDEDGGNCIPDKVHPMDALTATKHCVVIFSNIFIHVFTNHGTASR